MLSEITRDAQRCEFLAASGWDNATITPFPGDASSRTYFRLGRSSSAILMDAPTVAEAPIRPPDASPEMRAMLEYKARARLAEPSTVAFAVLANALSARGFSAPDIFNADFESGFLVLEDFGDDLFAHMVPDREDELALYSAAADVLAALYRSTFETEPEAFGSRWRIRTYDQTVLLAETELFLDWYVPEQGVEPGAAAREDWRAAWREALAVLDVHARGLVLRDFHAENLVWLPERQAEARVGLLDFQDALFGHPAYDLVSLLEDARRDVSPDIVTPVSDRFFKAAGLTDHDAFCEAAAVLGAQRNGKILGIFVRLARRDGKPQYLNFLPRAARHFVNDLSHPILQPVRTVVEKIAPHVFAEAGQ